jgi:simple sugar transport system ATP-binding protein
MHTKIENIRKYFGSVKANDGISFTLEPGSVYGFLGENGAGKSTLMKILSGFQPPDSGHIILNEQPVIFYSPREAMAAGVGMLYQDPLDFPPFRIIDNYLLGHDQHIILDYRKAKTELQELTKRYSFDVDIHAYVDTLSLGERQQLELVRLLAGGAELLILDEPTTGISADQKDVLFATIRKLATDEGKTVILVSHKLAEVQELCDQVFILRHGKLVGEASIPCPNEKLVEMMFEHVPIRSKRPQITLEKPVLEIDDVSIETYQLSVKNISLKINSGEVFGLAGLEGSGQGLLQQACAGLIDSSSGKIHLDGTDITSLSYHQNQAAGIAYVAAGRLEEGLVAGLSLTEHNILAAPKNRFMINWETARTATQNRIDQFEVIGTPESNVEELSGGNQQRLLISLLNEPLKLVLLEHPTRGLDVRSTDYIWEQLYQRRVDGTAIMFISADLDEIIDRSDRIAVFSGGVMSRVVDARKTTVDELGHLIGGQA